MDRRTPYTLSVLAPSTDGADESRTTTQNRLRDFVLEFQLDNAFIYRYDIPHSCFREACSPEADLMQQRSITTECACEAILLRH